MVLTSENSSVASALCGEESFWVSVAVQRRATEISCCTLRGTNRVFMDSTASLWVARIIQALHPVRKAF